MVHAIIFAAKSGIGYMKKEDRQGVVPVDLIADFQSSAKEQVAAQLFFIAVF